VCRLGFGGYRVNDDAPVHRGALERALAGGVNLVDTSTNYTDGGSERLVGRVVGEAIRKGRVAREEIVIVSKIGYVQGENLALAEERQTAGRAFPEMVHYQEGCWHCVHPEFLEDQLARSLGRLGLRTLDVCLLHNPEYFLSDAAHRGGGALEAARDEFYRRLAAAFRFFEERVAAGTLGWYGVSSNTVAHPVHDPEATSLARMLAAAREAGGPGHHFGVLQLPMNLFEAGGTLERNNPPDAPASARRTVLELASAESIGVLVNRPLNAVVGSGMVRLADFVIAPTVALDRQLETVRKLEAEYRKEIAAHLRVGANSEKPENFLRWADQLAASRASRTGSRSSGRCRASRLAWSAPSTPASPERSPSAGASGATATGPSSTGCWTASGRRPPAGARSRARPSAPPSTRASRRSDGARDSPRRPSGRSPARPASARCSWGCGARPTSRTRPRSSPGPRSPTRGPSTKRSAASACPGPDGGGASALPGRLHAGPDLRHAAPPGSPNASARSS
jgi:aryl-alcohol dehydrogenase-like predicted oxidoreductase